MDNEFGHRQILVIPSPPSRKEAYPTPPRVFLCPLFCFFEYIFVNVHLKEKAHV